MYGRSVEFKGWFLENIYGELKGSGKRALRRCSNPVIFKIKILIENGSVLHNYIVSKLVLLQFPSD